MMQFFTEIRDDLNSFHNFFPFNGFYVLFNKIIVFTCTYFQNETTQSKNK